MFKGGKKKPLSQTTKVQENCVFFNGFYGTWKREGGEAGPMKFVFRLIKNRNFLFAFVIVGANYDEVSYELVRATPGSIIARQNTWKHRPSKNQSMEIEI